jgi:hypothetical protein
MAKLRTKYSDVQIARILDAGKSPRYRRIETYQKYWDGTVYEGRPGFLDQSVDVPLLERAPCVVYPIVRAATQAISSMTLGHGKFPEILSLSSEDDTSFDVRFGLSTEESVIFDAGVKKISEQARLPAVCQQLVETALNSGSCVPIVSLNNGRIRVAQLDPKVCTPTFDPKNNERVLSVEVSYRYVEDYFDKQDQKWAKRVMQFRRVIDTKTDITFIPKEIENEKDHPVPGTPDPDKTFTHGFGFCPVIWYAHRATISDTQGFDGRPIHWGLASQLDALHFAYSQRHRAALYCGDPQYWETGVDPDDKPQNMGRTAVAPQPTSDNPQGKPMRDGWAFGTGGGRSRPARKKGPGAVWQYSSPDTKVGMMTLPGDALKAIDTHAADLRIKICEALGITFVDPSQLKGAGDISGKTLAFIFALQVATCNALREDFGRKCLLPLLNLIYQVILSPAAADGALYLAGVKDLVKIFEKFRAPVGQEPGTGTEGAGLVTTTTSWFEPAQQLVWGQYFEPSDVDEATQGAVAQLAHEAGLITLTTAVEHIRGIFAISNVDQYVLKLQEENAAKAALEIKQAGDMASVTGKLEGGGTAGGKKKSKKGGGREAAAMMEPATNNPVPKRTSPETRAWRKPSKKD